MAQKRLDPKHHDDIDDVIERVRRLTNTPLPTSTFEREMITCVQQDNEKLVAEIERLRQLVSDLRSQRTLEGVRQLEKEFPRKGKSRSTSRRTR
jgi:hypothetical protein